MIKLDKEQYLDKLHACWIGKNIGGTIGAPYEGTTQICNVTGFLNEKGEPLANDDLDLQLVWLYAVEEVGPKYLNTNTLAEYWLDWIPPYWNEYGICKTNLSLGLLPPMSGEFDNDRWKTSNGAWIRSEVWAGLAPGVPDVAVKYAVMDAMVDHGVSEGVFAEIFTASMQSLAYIESDIRTLINSALTKIPSDSLVAKTVRLVIDCYDMGVDYMQTREKVVEFTKELGWFQSPANLGFVVIGLLYGEGDFKKSMIYAVNCGDDTDCTGATVGATLGIIGGKKAIPQDWADYIGDKIITKAINGVYVSKLPKTCTALTNRVSALVPSVMKENGVDFEFSNENDYSKAEVEKFNKLTSCDFLNRSPFSFDITEYHAFDVRVELDKTPRIKSGEERKITLTFKMNPTIKVTKKLILKVIVPQGWAVNDYNRTVLLEYKAPIHDILGISKTDFTIIAGDNIDVINKCYVEITSPTLPYSVMFPITFIG